LSWFSHEVFLFSITPLLSSHFVSPCIEPTQLVPQRAREKHGNGAGRRQGQEGRRLYRVLAVNVPHLGGNEGGRKKNMKHRKNDMFMNGARKLLKRGTQ
jgi:hypothetical protein